MRGKSGSSELSVMIGLLAAVAAAVWPLSSAAATRLLACADRAEMPPFTFALRVDGRASDKVTGVSVDLLRKIGDSQGWELQLSLLPWARCLLDVATNYSQIAINVGLAEAQAAGLLLSKPYFSTHAIYAYSLRAHPQGLDLTGLDDLRRYHVCGLGGYRFESFGIDTASVDRGVTRSYEQLITKLHLGRCDLIIDNRETIAGMYLIDPNLRSKLTDVSLVIKPLPGAPQRELYFGVSAKSPQAKQIVNALNEGLDRLGGKHEIDKLIDKLIGQYMD